MLLTIIEWGRKVNEMNEKKEEMKWNRKSVRRVPTSFFYISLSFIQNRLILCILYFVITRAVSRDESTCTFIHEIFWNEWIIAVVNLHAIFFSVLFSPRRDSLSLELFARESTTTNQDQKPTSPPPITCTWLVRGASNWLIVNKFLFGFGSLMKGFCKPLFADDSARFLRCEWPTKCCWKRRRHVEGVSRDS